jgi:hypothetical protein
VVLLDDALDAHGGLARWRALRRFTLHVSLGGRLIARKGKAGILSEAVAEGSTIAQSVQITMPARRYVYAPDLVAIEGPDGTVLATRDDPGAAFLGRPDNQGWDELDFAFFAGRTIWARVAMPFLLADPDVGLEALEPWQEHAETWHRLRAVFPPRIATPAAEQILYFDETGLLRRLDHQVPGSELRLANYAGAHQRFSGITLPTLCRWLRIGPDGKPARKPEVISMEIFDARFE